MKSVKDLVRYEDIHELIVRISFDREPNDAFARIEERVSIRATLADK